MCTCLMHVHGDMRCVNVGGMIAPTCTTNERTNTCVVAKVIAEPIPQVCGRAAICALHLVTFVLIIVLPAVIVG